MLPTFTIQNSKYGNSEFQMDSLVYFMRLMRLIYETDLGLIRKALLHLCKTTPIFICRLSRAIVLTLFWYPCVRTEPESMIQNH